MARNLIAGGIVLIAVAVAVAVPVLTLSQAPPPPPAPTVDTSMRRLRDVVMVRCNAAATDFAVMAYQGSTEAPLRRATSCPETISRLLRDGFAMRDIGHFEKDGDFTVFTLVR